MTSTEQVREGYSTGLIYVTGRTGHGEEFDAWLRSLKAEIWAEGYEEGWYDSDPDWGPDDTRNPYRS